MSTEKEIIQAIGTHVVNVGGVYGDWYVGVAIDPRERLFTDHNVREKEDAWIYRQALSSDTARCVERHFLDQGMDGGSGGGDESSTYVYSYKKARHTNP